MRLPAGTGAAGFRSLFPADDVPRILRALLQACANVKKQCNTEIENRITSRVWKHARRIEPFRDGPLGLELKSAVLDTDAERDMPEGEVDLKVTCGRGPDTYFAIEAKRLRVQYPNGRLESGAPQYVDAGMMRFIAGQYAPRMSSGAMLGYVFDGNLPAAREDISKAVEARRNKLKLLAGPALRPSAVLAGRAVDETVHSRGGRKLTLFHILSAV